MTLICITKTSVKEKNHKIQLTYLWKYAPTFYYRKSRCLSKCILVNRKSAHCLVGLITIIVRYVISKSIFDNRSSRMQVLLFAISILWIIYWCSVQNIFRIYLWSPHFYNIGFRFMVILKFHFYKSFTDVLFKVCPEFTMSCSKSVLKLSLITSILKCNFSFNCQYQFYDSFTEVLFKNCLEFMVSFSTYV